jgi:hypothetical protein
MIIAAIHTAILPDELLVVGETVEVTVLVGVAVGVVVGTAEGVIVGAGVGKCAVGVGGEYKLGMLTGTVVG